MTRWIQRVARGCDQPIPGADVHHGIVQGTPHMTRQTSVRSVRALGAGVLLTGLLYQFSTNDSIELPDSVFATKTTHDQIEETALQTSGPLDRTERPLAEPPLSVDPSAMLELPADPKAPLTDEQIALLERTITQEKTERDAIQAELNDPANDYEVAEQALNELEQARSKLQSNINEAEQAGEQERLATLRAELKGVESRWAIAKDRFELEIRELKADRQRVALLSQSIATDEARLNFALGANSNQATLLPSPAQPEVVASPGSTAVTTPDSVVSSGDSAPSQAQPTLPVSPPFATPLVNQGATGSGNGKAPSDPPEKSRELIQAEKEAERRASNVQQLETDLAATEREIANIAGDIRLARDSLENARRLVDNARQARDLTDREYRELTSDTERDQFYDEVVLPANNEVANAEQEVRSRAEALNDALQRQANLYARLAVLREQAATARQLEDAARSRVQWLSNPFSPTNMARYAGEHGPTIIITVLGMCLLIWLIDRFSHRITKMIVTRGSRGTQSEREDRATTLAGVFQNAATGVIIVGGGITILDEAGVPIGPILAAAGVLGLAISFGAQNLVSDLFYGFVILLENQYKLNDVVTINNHTGQVERITLRMTALRDLEGRLHFVPNGQINSVINMTHGWSRSLFDIGVAYKEDVDHVMKVIMEVAEQLREDPRFRSMILEDPTMLGVDAFADSAVVIKFFIKTRPLKQWDVKREMLRRLKIRFDEIGIEIPFPHRTVYHQVAQPLSFDVEPETPEQMAPNGQVKLTKQVPRHHL